MDDQTNEPPREQGVAVRALFFLRGRQAAFSLKSRLISPCRRRNVKIPIEQLLRWRLAQAEAEAPPAPRAARLLERARPWWESWPERFQSVIERLTRIQIAYGHAMAEPQSRSGHPVPALIVHTVEE